MYEHVSAVEDAPDISSLSWGKDVNVGALISVKKVHKAIQL